MINLLHGDCLELMKDIPDDSIDMILCDLPYGTTQNKWDCVIDFDILWQQYNRVCHGAIVLTAQTPFDKILGASNIQMLKYEWIWEKEQGTGHLNAKKAPLKNHENILVFYKNQPTYNPQFVSGKSYSIVSGKGSDNYGSQKKILTNNTGYRYPLSVLKFNRDKNKIHPTQKPVSLMEYLIRTYTNEGETVMDNTKGSGTTGVACVNTNRNFIGMEMDDNYFEIAKNRINQRVLEKSTELDV